MLKLFLLIVAIFSPKLASANCNRDVYENGVPTEADGRRVIDKHNELRLKIAHGEVPGQPKGTNLRRMIWDPQLAQKAQDITNTCNFQHVPVDDPRWNWVGQNLFKSSSTALTYGADWEGVVQSWFDEHVDYHYPDNSNDATGHYTQVVWADSVYVGCGFTNFLDDNGWYSKLIACNYGPGGNWVGQAPYEAGGSGCEDLC